MRVTLLLSWAASTAVAWWMLFRGGADQIENSWWTEWFGMPGMDARELRTSVIAGWLVATILLGLAFFGGAG